MRLVNSLAFLPCTRELLKFFSISPFWDLLEDAKKGLCSFFYVCAAVLFGR